MTPVRGRRRWLFGLSSLLTGLASRQAAAAQAGEGVFLVEGRPVAERATVAAVELRLNGVGVRAVAWFKAFVAALYLDAPARTAAEAVAVRGPKRLQMQMLHEVPAEELVKALRKGIARNSPPATQDELAPAMEALAGHLSALGRLKRHDVIDLDWDPTRGVLLRRNGTLAGTVARADALFPAVLLSFVGDRPYDARLKAGLLAGRASPAERAPRSASSSSPGV